MLSHLKSTTADHKNLPFRQVRVALSEKKIRRAEKEYRAFEEISQTL